MATFDPVEASVREVLHDISYFEGFDLPASPPETPPMKSGFQMSSKERTPMHSSLEKMFPKTPPQSPRNGLKRKFSNNVKSAFGSVLPLTPPATPPTRFGIHSTLARTVSDTVNKGHQISIYTLKNRPTIVTIDVTESSRRSSLQRSSSYSLESAGSASKDPLDRVRDYSARSTDARYPTESPCAPPAYSPPPNTPANAYVPPTNFATGAQTGGFVQHGAQENDTYNPFSYTGPTQYPNHSLQRAPTQPSNGLWQGNYATKYPNLPSPRTFQQSNSSRSGVVDLEKARRNDFADPPKKKRNCKRKALICGLVLLILLMLGIMAAIIVILRLKHHHKHHKRGLCINVPGMFRNGEWQKGYQKCT